jgi:hypothetical protein
MWKSKNSIRLKSQIGLQLCETWMVMVVVIIIIIIIINTMWTSVGLGKVLDKLYKLQQQTV